VKPIAPSAGKCGASASTSPTAEFQCYACKRHGRLGKLVQKLLGTASMEKAKEFIQEQITAGKAA